MKTEYMLIGGLVIGGFLLYNMKKPNNDTILKNETDSIDKKTGFKSKLGKAFIISSGIAAPIGLATTASLFTLRGLRSMREVSSSYAI